MGRPPCCDKANVKRGLWTAEEDLKILAYVSQHGTGNWTLVPKKAGLNRCGKSCRLRWTNYLRPDLKHESFSPEEEQLIINYHRVIGSRWSLIAKKLPGRTDNDVKNYWNTKLRKKLMKMGIDPVTHKSISQIVSDYNTISGGGSLPDPSTGPPLLHAAAAGPHFNLAGNPTQEVNRNFFYNSTPWNLLQQHHFMNEITASSCSYSSPASSTVTNVHLSSPEPTPFMPFQAPLATTYPPPIQPGLIPHHGGFPLGAIPLNPREASNGDAFVDALLDQDSRIQSEIGELLDGILDY